MVRTACRAALVAAMSVLCPCVDAADAAATRLALGIEAQPLRDALARLAEQTGLQIMQREEDASADGFTAPRVVGGLSPREALEELLASSGLTYEFLNERMVRISARDPSRQRDVDGAKENEALIQVARGEAAPGQRPLSSPARAGLNEATSDSHSEIRLDEIIVTAQKRPQAIQDVPISIVAVDGESLRQRGVKDLYDLSASVPNLWISQSFTQGYMSIRGVTSGINPGFESTVGLVIDGYFYPRNSYSRLAFLDVERIEVLRGPQGALIGKNTTAGAINITTASPTDTLAGWAEVTGEFEGDVGYTMNGALSGPFTDALKGRLAVSFDDRDGFMRNNFTGKDTPRHRDLYARGTLNWLTSEDFSLTASYSVADLHANGRPIELLGCDQPFIDNRLAAAHRSGYEDCTLNFVTSADFGRPQLGPGQYDAQDTDADIANVTAEWKTRFGTVTSLTGVSSINQAGQQSGYSTALLERAVDFGDNYTQWSEELRLTSESGARYDYIAGAHYLHAKQHTYTGIHLYGPQLSANVFGRQESDAYSGFGQFTWHAKHRVDITAEGRFTHEEKDGRLYSTFSALFDPSIVRVLRYDISPQRNESNFSPGVNITWHAGPDTMFYASARRGYKGGGFNHFLTAASNTEASSFAEFGEESVSAFEVGTKVSFADGAAELSAAIFRSKFDDLQVTANVQAGPLAAFTVANAASAISQGTEVELRWRPISALTLAARAAYLDASYESFPNSACEQPQDASVGCFSSPTTHQLVKDLSGQPMPYAPKWNLSFDAEYAWALPGGKTLVAHAEVIHMDEYYTEFLLDKDTLQHAWTKLNAGVSLMLNESWRIQVIGRNLTNQKTFYGAGDINISQGHTTNGIPDPPRSIAVQATFRL